MFLFITSASFAGKVEVNYAMQVAANFYNQNVGKSVTLNLAYEVLNKDAGNGINFNEPLYYIFNAAGNKGFVIVSAEDLTKPIIAYNTTGGFKMENAPPVITSWLDKYSKQIAYVKANRATTSPSVTTQWNNYYNNIRVTSKQLRSGGATGPLLTTTWDQDLYYNALCPADANSPNGYGGNVPTGCGATAMSQIMRYWSYPAQGTGSHSYVSNYGTLSANFGATTYNWANMPNSLTSANNDVATIMYQCGVAVEMTYQYNESLSYILNSGGVPASCQTAYTTYFGYDPNTLQGLARADYAENNWKAFIQNELDSGRPVQYAGSGSDGGHTWVLDGSDVNGNFHLNWGWSGTDNGYYSIDALDPAPDPNGNFDNNESMLIGIQPLNITPNASDIELYAPITVNPDPIPFNTVFTVSTNLVNDGNSGFNGEYCAALFDASGNFVRYIGPILSTNGNALLAGNYYTGGLTFSDSSTITLTAPGNYTIGIYYLPSGSNNWLQAGSTNYTNPVSVTINGPSNSNISLYSNISPSPATFFQGQPASVTVNLINNGSTTYLGTYEAVLLDLSGNLVQSLGTYTESVGLPAGDIYNPSLTFNSNSITVPEGEYILAIGEEESGTSNYYYCGGQTYSNPILIDVVNSGFSTAVQQVATTSIKIYPNPARDFITIDAGNNNGNFTLKIFDAIGQVISETQGDLNGQKISINVNSWAVGVYNIQLKTEAGLVNTKFVVK